MEDRINSKELFEKIMRLQWLLQRQHMQNHGARGPFSDPTRGQGRVLALLKMQPEISTKDLSYLLNIRQQSLSELLAKLEKAGYITRFPLESDKRVVMVRLTEKGKDARQEAPNFTDLFDCLNPEEQSSFGDYLSRIIEKAEEELGEDDRADVERWMEQARSRMGDDAFEHLISMRGRGGSGFRNGHRRGEWDEGGFRGHCHGRPEGPRR